MNAARTLVLLCTFIAVVATSTLVFGQTAIPLEQAVKDGKVEVEISGIGGSTGDAILITARRKVPDVLRLTLTAGTVFKSISGTVQNMMGAGIKGDHIGENSYRPATEIVLTDNDKHSYVVEAYCLDFHKDNPGPSDSFTIAPPDERANKILKAGKNKSASIGAIQSALWIHREGLTPSQVKERFPVSDDDIAIARELLGDIKKSVGQSPAGTSEQRKLATAEEKTMKSENAEDALKKMYYTVSKSDTGSTIVVIHNAPGGDYRHEIAAADIGEGKGGGVAGYRKDGNHTISILHFNGKITIVSWDRQPVPSLEDQPEKSNNGAIQKADSTDNHTAQKESVATTIPNTPKDSMRKWTDSTGKFTTEAGFVDFKDGQVQLKKKDGKTITIPIEKLSEVDRNYLQKQVHKSRTSNNNDKPSPGKPRTSVVSPTNEVLSMFGEVDFCSIPMDKMDIALTRKTLDFFKTKKIKISDIKEACESALSINPTISEITIIPSRKDVDYKKIVDVIGKSDIKSEGKLKVSGMEPSFTFDSVMVWQEYEWLSFAIADEKVIAIRVDCTKLKQDTIKKLSEDKQNNATAHLDDDEFARLTARLWLAGDPKSDKLSVMIQIAALKVTDNEKTRMLLKASNITAEEFQQEYNHRMFTGDNKLNQVLFDKVIAELKRTGQ